MDATGDPARAAAVRQYTRLNVFRGTHPGVRIGCPAAGAWQACWQRGQTCWVITRYELGDLLDVLDQRFRKTG